MWHLSQRHFDLESDPVPGLVEAPIPRLGILGSEPAGSHQNEHGGGATDLIPNESRPLVSTLDALVVEKDLTLSQLTSEIGVTACPPPCRCLRSGS